jgi:hypothetical protein
MLHIQKETVTDILAVQVCNIEKLCVVNRLLPHTYFAIFNSNLGCIEFTHYNGFIITDRTCNYGFYCATNSSQ